MVRSILATAVGVVIGVTILLAIQWAGQQAFPPAFGAGNDASATSPQSLETAPFGALLMLLLSYLFGACDGAMVAAWLAPQRPWLHAGLVTALIAVPALLNLLAMPHPYWFSLATPLILLLAWLVGGKIGCMLHDRRRAGIGR